MPFIPLQGLFSVAITGKEPMAADQWLFHWNAFGGFGVAFGNRVAFASREEDYMQGVDVRNGQRVPKCCPPVQQPRRNVTRLVGWGPKGAKALLSQLRREQYWTDLKAKCVYGLTHPEKTLRDVMAPLSRLIIR
jgi:hypothetical protein